MLHVHTLDSIRVQVQCNCDYAHFLHILPSTICCRCCCMCAGVWGIVGGVPDDLDECNWSAGDATPDGSTVFLATSAGQLSLMDTRTANSSSAAPHLTISNRCALNWGVC